MDIRWAQIYPIEPPSRYKLHVACWDGSNQPLDVFVRNREGWNDWNRWRGDHHIGRSGGTGGDYQLRDSYGSYTTAAQGVGDLL